MQAPNCMLLRKHIIVEGSTFRSQPDFERIIEIKIEHLDELEMSARKRRSLKQGKHSNIIFVNNDDVISDSIKHISANISSNRGFTWTCLHISHLV